MQYHIQTLVKHLFDKDSFEQVTAQELKQFTEEYPYAAVGQFLYAKKLKESGSYNHYEQSEQASLYFHNALWLRWQLDRKEEVPALAAKAEEQAHQPGFRIVVQMPKSAPAVITPKPAVQQEENQEQQPVMPETNPEVPVAATAADIQPEAADTPAAVPEATTENESTNNLQVNENGALVEQPVETTESGEPEKATEETPSAETASAVAIAESSQLAEESVATDAAVNAVSITEEVLTPATPVSTDTTETAVTEVAKEDADEIVPALEITKQELENAPVEDDIIPAVEATSEELAAITPVVEQVTGQPVEAVEATALPAETVKMGSATEVIETAPTQPPAEIAIEEQAVEEIADIVPSAESAEPVTEQSKPFGLTQATQEGRASVDLGEPIFESYHTIDYFASQGIKLMQEELKDRLGKQLKSFTDWLRSMKRIGPMETNTSLDEVTNQSIQRIAEHSVEEKEVLTEAMAEVWAKQGNTDKAIRVYEKLSLLNPDKRPYFAGRIEQLKAQ